MPKTETLLDLLSMKPQPAKISDSAIVIVDAQKEYLVGKVRLSGIEDALVEIRELLGRARKAGSPVFHMVHNTVAGAPIFDPDSELSEIIDAVAPEGDEPVLAKNLPSSFVNTDLDKLLKETGKLNLVLAGFMTHMCINATARSAVDLGYSPTIVASACATRDLPGPDGQTVPAETVHKSNLASLADLVAVVAQSVEDLS